jgi:hypothetical protein
VSLVLTHSPVGSYAHGDVLIRGITLTPGTAGSKTARTTATPAGIRFAPPPDHPGGRRGDTPGSRGTSGPTLVRARETEWAWFVATVRGAAVRRLDEGLVSLVLSMRP